MRVLPYGQRQERSGLDPVLSPVGHRNARYQVTRESPDPSLSLRYPHEARAQIGKSCGANGASPLGQRCTPRLLFLRRDVSEPPVELGRAVARIRAGNERLIVQFDTEIERFRIHNYRPRVFVILENLTDDFVDGECVRAGNLDRTVYRFGDGPPRRPQSRHLLPPSAGTTSATGALSHLRWPPARCHGGTRRTGWHGRLCMEWARS